MSGFTSSFPPLSGAPAAFPEKYASHSSRSTFSRILHGSAGSDPGLSGSPSGRRPLSCNPSGKVPLSTLHPPPCSLIKCGNPGRRFPFRPSLEGCVRGLFRPSSFQPPRSPSEGGHGKEYSFLFPAAQAAIQPPSRRREAPAKKHKANAEFPPREAPSHSLPRTAKSPSCHRGRRSLNELLACLRTQRSRVKITQ